MGLEQFPLMENALPRVKVPVKRFEAWKEVVLDEVARAVSNRESWYNAFKTKLKDGYEMINDEPQLKAFMRNVRNSKDKDILIRSTLQGVTLDDLVAGFYVDNTYDARCSYAHMYEDHFLDGGVLQVHEGRDEQDPLHFVGMKWVCVRSPAPTLIKSRDFLYFTFEGTVEDADGNRVLFRFLRTMPMDDIEVDESDVPSGHLVRGRISNLHLYRQNGACVEGYTKVVHSYAGNVPSWVATKTVSLIFPGIINMETISDARALLAMGMAKLNVPRVVKALAATVTTPASVAAPNSCSVCLQKFKMTRTKRRCTSCKHVVCKRCTRSLWLYDEDKVASNTGCVAQRFCMNCMRQARTQVQELARHSRTSQTSNSSQNNRPVQRSSNNSSNNKSGRRPTDLSNASHGSYGSHNSQNNSNTPASHDGTSHDYHQQRKYPQAHGSSTPHRPQYEPEYSQQAVSLSSSLHHYAPPYNAHLYQQGGYQRERGLSANSLDDTSEYSPYGNPRELESDDDGAESYDSRGMRRPHRQHPHPHQQLHGSQSSRSDSFDDPQRPMSPSEQYAYDYAQEQLQMRREHQERQRQRQLQQQEMPYNARMLPPASRSTSSSSSSVRDPNAAQPALRGRSPDPDAVQDVDALFRRQMQINEGDNRGDEIQKALVAAQLAQQDGRPQTSANAHLRYQ